MLRIFLLYLVLVVTPWKAFTQERSSRGGDSYVGQTQQRRSAERFNIIDYIMGQRKIISEQNARLGSSGRSGPSPDFVLTYQAHSGEIRRDSTLLGEEKRSFGRLQFLLDGVFSEGNKKRLLNIDVGVEGYWNQSTDFKVDVASTQMKHNYIEKGGALLLRPFGRSSQDTGLLLKFGYLDLSEMGFWYNDQIPQSLFSTYAGGEVKMYLLPFLGVHGDYQYVFERESTPLAGKWKMYRFLYGGFLEVYLLNLEAHLVTTEFTLTPTDTALTPIKEIFTGAGFSATLYF